MKKIVLISFLLLFSCKTKQIETTSNLKPRVLSLSQANQLAELPLRCIAQEYPNKLGQVITNQSDLAVPSELHPVFYGCFDWHSAVHGHWSLVRLLKNYPDLEKSEAIKTLLRNQLTKEKIAQEMRYFDKEYNKTYERTYGWAWLLKLSAELKTWDTEIGRELSENLEPLSLLISKKYKAYLPKLNYPIRVGTHSNTAFGLSFAYDYAIISGDTVFADLIHSRAKDFYIKDQGCPINWEPGGYDFLSPCIEEVDIMRKVLSKDEFVDWLSGFFPDLLQPDFDLTVGEVSDRTDGHMVHLDGLNFSRAWCFYGLANQYPEFDYLKKTANKHIAYSLPNLVGDDYEGGHWLASFAINAMPLH